MAKVDVIMPQMGESIAEGTLIKWLKREGEEVERDEDLFEISTDKVDADIPSPSSGVLAEILVAEGETVEVGTLVARIETEIGAAGGDGRPPAEAVEEPPLQAHPPQEPPAEEAPGAQLLTVTLSVAVAAPPPAAEAPTPTVTGPATREERLRTRSTPLVRKIAAEHDVDITRIDGSGIAGRVTRDDIVSFLEARGPEAEAAPAESPRARAPVTVEPAAETPPGVLRLPIRGATLEVKLPRVPIREGDRVEDMSRVRLRTM